MEHEGQVAATLTPSGARGQGREMAQPTVLVVEDEPDIAEVIAYTSAERASPP